MTNKPFRATRSKKDSAALWLCLLLPSVVGLEFTYAAYASGPTPIYDKPIITLLIPNNSINAGNQTTILFNVAMPSTWESNAYNGGPLSLWGTIRNVTCLLDQEQILFNDTAYGRDAKPVTVGGTTYYPANYPISINYTCSASQISSGPHSLTIFVGADTLGTVWVLHSDGYHYPTDFYTDVSTNETFTFDVTPTLSASLAESASALNFGNIINFTVTVEGGVAPYTYGWFIDDQLVQTSNSPYYSTNTQPVGPHHIYAKVTDTDGNTAQTLSPEFNVLPTSSLSPSPSEPQQPTTEPTPTPSPSVPEIPTWTILPFTAVAAVLLVFLVRRRKP